MYSRLKRGFGLSSNLPMAEPSPSSYTWKVWKCTVVGLGHISKLKAPHAHYTPQELDRTHASHCGVAGVETPRDVVSEICGNMCCQFKSSIVGLVVLSKHLETPDDLLVFSVTWWWITLFLNCQGAIAFWNANEHGQIYLLGDEFIIVSWEIKLLRVQVLKYSKPLHLNGTPPPLCHGKGCARGWRGVHIPVCSAGISPARE